jgi:hypothetical protein
MRNDILVELEQVIVQLPDRAFASTYLVLSSSKSGKIERRSVSRKEAGNAEDFARASRTR